MRIKVIEEKIRSYYLKGLTYAEIGKLLDVSSKTVQRYISDCNIKEEINQPKTLEQRAIDLHNTGFSYSDIARKLKVSRTTAYLWNKKYREKMMIDGKK